MTKQIHVDDREGLRKALAEHEFIGLNAAQWEGFMTTLDAPTEHHPRMERLLNEPTILD